MQAAVLVVPTNVAVQSNNIGWLSLSDQPELLLKSQYYRFMELRGCKIEYEPSLAPNESYPLRNGTFGLHYNTPGFLQAPAPTDATNSACPVNGTFSPWKPFSYYVNIAKHFKMHSQNRLLTFANN